MIYKREITNPVTIQFIILFTLYNADAPLTYSDMLNIILENCNILFTDFQLALHNLTSTDHVESEMITDRIEIFEITDKGRNVSDFFNQIVPVYIREPLLDALKAHFIEKRRKDAVRAEIKAVSIHDYRAECSLYDDDKTQLLELNVFAGSRDDAHLMVEGFKANYTKIYESILRLITDVPPKETKKPFEDMFETAPPIKRDTEYTDIDKDKSLDTDNAADENTEAVSDSPADTDSAVDTDNSADGNTEAVSNNAVDADNNNDNE